MHSTLGGAQFENDGPHPTAVSKANTTPTHGLESNIELKKATSKDRSIIVTFRAFKNLAVPLSAIVPKLFCNSSRVIPIPESLTCGDVHVSSLESVKHRIIDTENQQRSNRRSECNEMFSNWHGEFQVSSFTWLSRFSWKRTGHLRVEGDLLTWWWWCHSQDRSGFWFPS